MAEDVKNRIIQIFIDSISDKQESHITAGHALLQYVEDLLLKSCWLSKD